MQPHELSDKDQALLQKIRLPLLAFGRKPARTRISDLERDNAELRELVGELSKKVAGLGPRKAPYIPKYAFVDPTAVLDPSVYLMTAEDKPITIGARTRIARQTEMIGPVVIGAGCLINVGGFIRANVTIGDSVLVGPFTRFMTDTHELGGNSKRAMKPIWPPITVGDGTWIGAGVTILGNVTIGAGCVIAAGAVVTKDVPDNTIVGGVPARIIRQLSDA